MLFRSGELLLLLYQSLRALLKPALPNTLVQLVFELRAMTISGEYTEHPPCQVSDSAAYAWEYIIFSPLESLYTFVLTPEELGALTEYAGQCAARREKESGPLRRFWEKWILCLY